jgi:hypothetical protein
METTMNRILTVTDEDDSLILEFVEIDDLRREGTLPKHVA